MKIKDLDDVQLSVVLNDKFNNITKNRLDPLHEKYKGKLGFPIAMIVKEVHNAIGDACVEIFSTRQSLKELVGEEVANDILGAIFATYDDTSKLYESEVE